MVDKGMIVNDTSNAMRKAAVSSPRAFLRVSPLTPRVSLSLSLTSRTLHARTPLHAAPSRPDLKKTRARDRFPPHELACMGSEPTLTRKRLSPCANMASSCIIQECVCVCVCVCPGYSRMQTQAISLAPSSGTEHTGKSGLRR